MHEEWHLYGVQPLAHRAGINLFDFGRCASLPVQRAGPPCPPVIPFTLKRILPRVPCCSPLFPAPRCMTCVSNGPIAIVSNPAAPC